MNRLFLCFIVFAAALISLAASPMKLRLACYNVQHCAGLPVKVEGVADGMSLIADAIKREKPDFIGLNEIDRKTRRMGYVDCPSELGRRTGLHATFAKAIPYQDGGYGVAVLSREKPISVMRIPLPGNEKRVLLLCEFADFWFGTTHLDFGEYQLMAVDIIRGIVQEKAASKPVFLTGDWNAVPDSQTLKAIKGFMTVISDEHSCTFHARKDYPSGKEYCIDYIAVDSAHSGNCRVIEKHVTKDIVASDHNLVAVEIAFDGKCGKKAVRNVE